MIKEPPLLTIRRNFPRPPEEIVEAFRNAASSHIADALGGRGAMSQRIKPMIAPNGAMVGVAMTCHAGPDDNLAVFAALDAVKPGDVIVVASDGFTETAVAGDHLLGMARNCGAAGFVTDGAVRDIDGIIAVGLPVYAAGVTPNSVNRNGPGTVGLPVIVGGAAVHAGDIVIGDRDGVVIVPREAAPQVLERLAAVRAAEAAMEAEVKGGLRTPGFLLTILGSTAVEEV